MTDPTEDVVEFVSLFADRDARSAADLRNARFRAEKRSQMTDRQRSRGGRARDTQLNLRTTRAVKEQANAVADKLGLPLIDVIEQAIADLAKKHGLGG